jgi:hypothetical protein
MPKGTSAASGAGVAKVELPPLPTGRGLKETIEAGGMHLT